jgi:hypothetical protein
MVTEWRPPLAGDAKVTSGAPRVETGPKGPVPPLLTVLAVFPHTAIL